MLPLELRQFNLCANYLSHVPVCVMSAHLVKLEKLDLSQNQLAVVPIEIANLKQLTELNLDDNVIISLPGAIGLLTKLKVLSLRNNRIAYSDKSSQQQPLPASLFSQTPLIDLNLHGNPLTVKELNAMDGFDKYLERRQQVKTSALMGGALTNLDVCGLE